jgi:hypothetical protein
MRIDNFLVIVLIIHENCVLVFKLECQSPISADTYRPMIPQLTSKLVQSPCGSIHIRGLRRVIEGEKLKPQLLGVFGLDTRLRPVPKNLSIPRCRNLLITLYSITIQDTQVERILD